MKIIAELSLYPLREDYGTVVIDFLEELKKIPHIEIKTNSMSTQIRGQWEDVMLATKLAMEAIQDGRSTNTLVIKIIDQPLEIGWLDEKATIEP